jgi:hypothetical protein
MAIWLKKIAPTEAGASVDNMPPARGGKIVAPARHLYLIRQESRSSTSPTRRKLWITVASARVHAPFIARASIVPQKALSSTAERIQGTEPPFENLHRIARMSGLLLFDFSGP